MDIVTPLALLISSTYSELKGFILNGAAKRAKRLSPDSEAYRDTYRYPKKTLTK